MSVSKNKVTPKAYWRFRSHRLKLFHSLLAPLKKNRYCTRTVLNMHAKADKLKVLTQSDRRNLSAALIQHLISLPNSPARNLLGVVLYTMFSPFLELRSVLHEIDPYLLLDVLKYIFNDGYNELFLDVASTEALWSMLSEKLKVELGVLMQEHLNKTVKINDFFFEHFSCHRTFFLNNLSALLRSNDHLNSISDFPIVGDLMTRYADQAGHRFRVSDTHHWINLIIPYLSRRALTYSGSWGGSFVILMRHFRIFMPFALEYQSIWPETPLIDEGTTISEAVITLMPLFRCLREPESGEPNVKYFSELSDFSSEFLETNPKVYFEALEFLLYLSNFMSLHAELQTEFYQLVAPEVLRTFSDQRADRLARRLSHVTYLADHNFHRILHLYIDNGYLVKSLRESSARAAGVLFNIAESGNKCLFVMLCKIQPDEETLYILREKIKSMDHGPTIQLYLDVYQSTTEWKMGTNDTVRVIWDIPEMLLRTDVLHPDVQIACLQLFLMKNWGLALDSTDTYEHDNELTVNDYEMILNFFLKRHCTLRKLRRTKVVIPRVRQIIEAHVEFQNELESLNAQAKKSRSSFTTSQSSAEELHFSTSSA